MLQLALQPPPPPPQKKQENIDDNVHVQRGRDLMYKQWMKGEGFSVETAVRNGNSLLQKFHPYVKCRSFRIL
jgi:hypothetical protein